MLNKFFCLIVLSLPFSAKVVAQSFPFSATNVETAVTSGHDFPAHKFLKNVNSLESAWKSWSSARAPQWDWQAVFRFNVRAAIIWQKLVDCHQGEAELAREAYRQEENYCPRNSTQNNELSQLIQILHSDVKLFLETTKIDGKVLKEEAFPIDIGPMGPEAVLPVKTWPSLFELYNNEDHVLPTIHPLFSQILLENFIRDYSFLSMEEENFPVGHYMRIRGTIEEKEARYITLEHKKQATRLENSWALVSLYPMVGCEIWGLWPYALNPILRSTSESDSTYMGKFGQMVFLRKYLYSCNLRSMVSYSIYSMYQTKMWYYTDSRYGDVVNDFIAFFRELYN